MENNKNAFPTWDMSFNENPELHVYSAGTGHGMSKRFYAACAAMQGLMANNEFNQAVMYFKKNEGKTANEIYAEMAFDAADELLKQEGENDE